MVLYEPLLLFRLLTYGEPYRVFLSALKVCHLYLIHKPFVGSPYFVFVFSALSLDTKPVVRIMSLLPRHKSDFLSTMIERVFKLLTPRLNTYPLYLISNHRATVRGGN